MPAICPSAAPAAGASPGTGVVEVDVTSEFSHIRVRRRGNLRSLIFVRDNGAEAVETILDVGKPQQLRVPYTQAMFASYLLRPQPKHVLIVGLGGGAMVQFLEHHQPELRVDAVEIDPAVVKIADEYFDVRSAGNVNIVTADAFKYLGETDRRYDVIYMDAFLKPSADTDGTGLPLRLKTLQFYKHVQTKLQDEGLVVFNLNRHQDVGKDINTIRGAFPQTYVFRVGNANVVVVGSMSQARTPSSVLRRRGRELDRRFQANFSFSRLVGQLVR